MSGFTLVDFTVPTREVAMTHPPAEAPLCEDCQSLDLCFFNPLCPGCQDILLDSKTTIPQLFAIMRQWVPQTQRNLPALTREILRRGANVNDRDGLTGLSLLHYACKSGAAGVGNITAATNLVISLISKGADTEARCRWTDMNAMHYAVYFNAAEIVQVLAEQTASLVMSTCSEFSNGTGLHMAATNLALDSAKVLLQNGADGSCTDSNGRKPYEVIPDNIPDEQAAACVELTQLLKNAAENPPFGRIKRGRSKSPAAKISKSPSPKPLPAPLVLSRQAESASHPPKAAAPAVPKSPAPSNNSTISTTSTQHTVNTGSIPSRTHSPAISEVTMASLGLKVGDRIAIDSASAKPKYGTLRFGGPTEFSPGQWAGVELDSEIGKNDGSYAGIRYFSCKAKFGLFVPMHRVSLDSRHAERRRKKMTKTRDTPTITASLVDEAPASPAAKGIQIGERVVLSGNRVGTLRFSGAVKFDSGHWMGVELDQPSGKNDGSKDNVRYFKCRPNYGVLVPKSKVKRAGGALKASATNTPVSSGPESVDYATGSGSISLATSGASGSSEAEASSPSPFASPSIARRKMGASSSSGHRLGGRSKQSSVSRSSGALSSSASPDITLEQGMSVFVNKEMGVVKFIGKTEFAEGEWLGVELRKPVGKNDGTVQGKRYFHCKPNHGLFVKPEKATHRGINCAKILPKHFS